MCGQVIGRFEDCLICGRFKFQFESFAFDVSALDIHSNAT